MSVRFATRSMPGAAEKHAKEDARLMELLTEIFPNQNELEYFLNECARCLQCSPANPRILFLKGEGGCGKGVVAELLERTYRNFELKANNGIFMRPQFADAEKPSSARASPRRPALPPLDGDGAKSEPVVRRSHPRCPVSAEECAVLVPLKTPTLLRTWPEGAL